MVHSDLWRRLAVPREALGDRRGPGARRGRVRVTGERGARGVRGEVLGRASRCVLGSRGLEGAARTGAHVLHALPAILDDLDPVKAKRLVDEHLVNEREFWLP